MKMNVMLVGIEHLMTGICFHAKGTDTLPGLQFERESPSIMRVACEVPFMAYWPVKQAYMNSHEREILDDPKHHMGEVEWYAQVAAPLLVSEWQRLKDAQYYSRVIGECGQSGSRLAPNEPPFTDAVIQAAVDKWGKDAHAWLTKVRWAGDHWYINPYHGMYLGIERDGYMHT